MTKGSLLYKLDNWKDKYNIEQGVLELETKLQENDLDYSNIIGILKYSRDSHGEISVLTSPSSDLGYIKFDKI